MSETNTPQADSSSKSQTVNPLLTRLLYVQIVKAEKLALLDKNGTNAYAAISLLDLAGRVVKGESFKTTTKKGEVAPTWDEKFTFGKSS